MDRGSRNNISTALRRLLTSAWLPFVLALLALLLTLPALNAGLALDDFNQRYTLLGRTDLPELPSLWQDNSLPTVMMKLFSLAENDPVSRLLQNDLGIFTWLMPIDGYVTFWRPLSALTHWLDYQLWPHAIWAMHLHNLLWFAAAIALTTRLYQRLMGPTMVAGLAALFYAVDDAHGLPVAWIANRNGVISFGLGILCLLFFVHWRQTEARRSGWMAAFCFALALLAAEAGVATLSYVVAYLLILDRKRIGQRLIAFAPFGGIFLLWIATHRVLGYGEHGTGLYLDPFGAPLFFLQCIIERAPILLLSQFGLPPAAVYVYLPQQLQQAWWALAVVVSLGIGWGLWRLLWRDAVARFWAVGMGLALIVACTSQPNERLLWFAGVGAMGLLAQWVAVLWRSARGSGGRLSRLGTGALLASIGLIHLVHAPIFLNREARLPSAGVEIQQALDSFPADEAFRSQTAVVINAPIFFYSSYLLPARSVAQEPFPLRVHQLVSSFNAIDISRPSAEELVIQPDGGFLTGGARLLRSPTMPMAQGDRFELTGMHIEVTTLTSDGEPLAARFVFSTPLEDASLRWLNWDAGNGIFVPFSLPAVGETVTLPPLVDFSP